MDAIEQAKAMQQERDDENAEMALLYAVGSSNDETVVGLLGLDWESWSSLPADVQAACEHFAKSYPDRYPSPPAPEPQGSAEVIPMPSAGRSPGKHPRPAWMGSTAGWCRWSAATSPSTTASPRAW